MTVYPDCKINLGLCVVERRPDGYHNLQTVFYPIPLRDELTVEPADKDSLTIEGIPIVGDPLDNLVMRVVRLLREEGRTIPPVYVHLKKNIPNGAGLGGGSSDAAYMMKLLSELFQLNLTTNEMEKRVARLGADCAVFIQDKPVYAEGIGNIFTPIELNLSGWYLVLVKPDDCISTKEAYAQIHPHYPEHVLLDVIKEDVRTWKGRMVNDFEESAFPQHPVVQGIRDRLYELGATYACMSGSGSSVFGLFPSEPHLEAEFEEHFLFTTRL